jgi:hypothetical protein
VTEESVASHALVPTSGAHPVLDMVVQEAEAPRAEWACEVHASEAVGDVAVDQAVDGTMMIMVEAVAKVFGQLWMRRRGLVMMPWRSG